MKTNFTEAQLLQAHIVEADKILKTCQHFGFCTSGCPTYVLLHNENDGPRGRIDLIREMLESDEAPRKETVEHLDKCLSCMSCMGTCAVKVDYMHLIDTARVHIEENYKRPIFQRILRNSLGYILPRPPLFRAMLSGARLASKVEGVVPKPLKHMLKLVPRDALADSNIRFDQLYPAVGTRKYRVAMLGGCVQPVMSPHINTSTISLLTKLGCEVLIPRSVGCCGSLNLHMGKIEAAKEFASRNVKAWSEEIKNGGLDAIIINASGCGTTVKDYSHLLQDNEELREPARIVSDLALDITEWLDKIGLPEPDDAKRYKIAYHDACSLRNAQKVTSPPRRLLRKAGFKIVDVPEGHFCCGSAGTYNLLQPDIAGQLGKRKAENIESTDPQIAAAGNIGCITQISQYSVIPIVHTIELLNWAYGGAEPAAIKGLHLQPLAAEVIETEQITQSQPPVTHSSDGDSDVGVW
ncbi:2-hydroxy-acid oxidase [Pseudomonas oryzihabitans]|nr:2-hydroxy-acid oxidase [Pseudomonas psychrotolerans]